MAGIGGTQGERNIKVTLTADVDAYVDGMERAWLATTKLADELRALGISEKDMPAAIRTALKLIRDEDEDPDTAVA